MVKFLDGPAAGESLMLRAAPEFLRVVHSPRRKPGNQWDALDQPGDEVAGGETVYAYRRVGNPTRMHLKMSPRSASGWYAMAEYRVVEDQPSEATMRYRGLWMVWVRVQQFQASMPAAASQ